MKSEAYKGHLAMLMANVLWGCMSPSSKIVLSSGLINAISLTTFRMLGAAIVFWIASIFTRKEHVPHEDLKHLFFRGPLRNRIQPRYLYLWRVADFTHRRNDRCHLHPHHHHDHRCFLPEGTDYGNEDPRYLCRGSRCPDAYSERTASGGNRKRQQ